MKLLRRLKHSQTLVDSVAQENGTSFRAAQAQIIFQTPRLKDLTAYEMIWTIQSGEQTVYIKISVAPERAEC